MLARAIHAAILPAAAADLERSWFYRAVAVSTEHMAGAKVRCLRSEKEKRPCEIFLLAETALQCAGQKSSNEYSPFLTITIFECSDGQRQAEGRRRHCIDR
jgi:hypothetical protein